MKNLNIALRSLFKKGRSNGIKILSLGVGLAMGLVLISKVCFERSFDKFYPDSDRIYRLHENIIRDGEYKSYGQVSGVVATAMQVEIPEVEKATRLTYIGGDKELFKTQDGNRYSARYVVMGDTNVFDLLPRPILIGDPKETLSRPGYVMISNRIAKLLGGAEQAVNKEFEFESSPGQIYTIGGVFEDVPENSHLRFEIVASLEGMSKWSRENWLGNDRYLGYVKLYPGTDPESLTTAIREMQGRHCDLEEVKKELLKVNNLAVEGKPEDMVITSHICRGNYHSTFFTSGPYDTVADYVFAKENVDALFLEYDDERSGGFAPLAKVSPDKKVVLGLITTKSPELEDKERVIHRINEAAKYVPLERLYLSPQCGFASCEIGNKLTEEQQWEKIKLVKEIAEEVWGE